MAVVATLFACDWCEFESSDYETDTEAAEHGWWLLLGLVRGEVKELAFCKEACRDSHLDYYAE